MVKSYDNMNCTVYCGEDWPNHLRRFNATKAKLAARYLSSYQSQDVQAILLELRQKTANRTFDDSSL